MIHRTSNDRHDNNIIITGAHDVFLSALLQIVGLFFTQVPW